MPDLAHLLGAHDDAARTRFLVGTLREAFADLMAASPAAFRTKFRKMAADPFAFYRGSAPVFYADVVRLDDPWADECTGRVWIQGDLHAENFGTYMDGDGALVFDVNDFDESYLGHFGWDLQRLVASIALIGRSKAFSDDDINGLVAVYARHYVDAVRSFHETEREKQLTLRRDNATGIVLAALRESRGSSRETLLASMTEIEGDARVFREGPGVRRLDQAEKARVEEAFRRYLDTIPPEKRLSESAYTVVDVVGRSGIGSAGLPAYNVLIEGLNEALDNDVVVSMKQAVRAAPSRVVDDGVLRSAFTDHGHRTAVSQRALQAHADRLLGHTTIDGVGYVVRELSPYETDLDWADATEPDQVGDALRQLGWATAKAHCVSDADADQELVPFQVEDAISRVLAGRDEQFVEWLVVFGREYADVVRRDHHLFVEAFRSDRIPGVSATHSA